MIEAKRVDLYDLPAREAIEVYHHQPTHVEAWLFYACCTSDSLSRYWIYRYFPHVQEGQRGQHAKHLCLCLAYSDTSSTCVFAFSVGLEVEQRYRNHQQPAFEPCVYVYGHVKTFFLDQSYPIVLIAHEGIQRSLDNIALSVLLSAVCYFVDSVFDNAYSFHLAAISFCVWLSVLCELHDMSYVVCLSLLCEYLDIVYFSLVRTLCELDGMPYDVHYLAPCALHSSVSFLLVLVLCELHDMSSGYCVSALYYSRNIAYGFPVVSLCYFREIASFSYLSLPCASLDGFYCAPLFALYESLDTPLFFHVCTLCYYHNEVYFALLLVPYETHSTALGRLFCMLCIQLQFHLCGCSFSGKIQRLRDRNLDTWNIASLKQRGIHP